MIYRNLLKPLLFSFPAEKAHHITTSFLGIILSIPGCRYLFKSTYLIKDTRLEKEILGLKFRNPVGLAAGFDKDGKYYSDMAALGFGFIEIGTVTPLAQKGNPQPRLFRLPQDTALINRMGFNNEGVDALVHRLKTNLKRDYIIGGNIGKNKITPNEDAVQDYLISFSKLYPYVDYFVVNVSSPNTPGLRELQDKGPLTRILSQLVSVRNEKSESKPILLKVAPDLELSQLDEVMEVIKDVGLEGIILANTTISRSNLKTSTAKIESIGNGGLSGAPLIDKSVELIKYVRSAMKDIVIIGVGGITTPADGKRLLAAGADLIQVYSGLVYYGPHLIKDINKSILHKSSK